MDKQECIERQLESALLEGRWGVFERLPSERGLAEAFGVNRATVRAALRALARLLQECTLPQCENVFAQLARLLSALRHADAGAAAKAVEGYATILLALQEAR